MYTFELPSGIEAVLRPITGNEESLLTDRRLMKNGTAVNQVLLNCLESLGGNEKPSMEDVLALLSGDRLFLLVRLRQVSFGEEVALTPALSRPVLRRGQPRSRSISKTWRLRSIPRSANSASSCRVRRRRSCSRRSMDTWRSDS